MLNPIGLNTVYIIEAVLSATVVHSNESIGPGYIPGLSSE